MIRAEQQEAPSNKRKTGYLVLSKLHARTVAAVNRRAITLLRQQPHPVYTLTCDNGAEFQGYVALEAATRALEERFEAPETPADDES